MSAQASPFFSVVIPTYNRATFIEATLDSVLAQTYQNLEILVVNDGSKDNTAEVVGHYADLRLRYYPKENAERSAARNYGLARAGGNYVIFLDSDDRFHPNHLATLHAKIEELSQPNFIATKFNFDRDGHRRPSDVMALPAGLFGVAGADVNRPAASHPVQPVFAPAIVALPVLPAAKIHLTPLR